MFKTQDIRRFHELQIFVTDIIDVEGKKGPIKIVKCEAELEDGKTVWLSFVYNEEKHSMIKKDSTFNVSAKYYTQNSIDEKTKKEYTNHYLTAVKIL